VSAPTRIGVIESLSAGFTLVARRPYLLAVPILMDALAWGGPRLTAAPVMDRLAQRVLSATAQAPIPPDQLLDLHDQVEQIAATAGRWNVLDVLAWQAPNMLSASATDGPGPSVSVSSLGVLLLLLLGLACAAVLVGCVFFAPIASAVRTGSVRGSLEPARLTRLWGRYISYVALLIGIVAGLGIVAALLAGIGSLLSGGLVAIVVLLAVGVGIVLSIYLFLAEEAILVGGAGPLEAVRQSFAVVSRHFWSVVGLLALVYLITLGLGLVWDKVSTTTPGLIGASIGNAFIATGLAASVMIYYWERYKSISSSPPLPTGTGERRFS